MSDLRSLVSSTFLVQKKSYQNRQISSVHFVHSAVTQLSVEGLFKINRFVANLAKGRVSNSMILMQMW